MRESVSLSDSASRIVIGGGSMGELIRKYKWQDTSIGGICDWPASVRTAVNICLNSRFPMVLWLGEDLNILYNDAWAPILGKRHPAKLGSPGRDVWPEIWNIIGPMLQGVLTSGQATWSEDMLLPLERNGFTEECYFTYSYSPIYSDNQKSEGAFSAVSETTMQVIRQRRLATMKDLGTRVEGSNDIGQSVRKIIDVLNENLFDLPAFGLYLLNEDGTLQSMQESLHSSVVVSETMYLSLFDERQAVHSYLTQPHSVSFPDDGWKDDLKETYSLPILDADNSTVGVLVCSIAPWLIFDEEYQSFLELICDQIKSSIDSSKSYEREQERARKLAELDQAKSEFFNNVSHELRTPLTLIKAPLEEMLRKPSRLSNTTIESMKIMLRNTTRLQKLVNGLLDFSKIEDGKLLPVFKVIDIAEYTRGLASLFQSAIETAGMNLEVNCKSPIYAAVDASMWEKIIINLLSNAFKHSFNGTISVEVITVGSMAQITVKDTGIGISESNLESIFERFKRVEGADSRTHEGTGIGLAVVKELVKLHKGEIQVESQINLGTTFKVLVPISDTIPQEKIEDKEKHTVQSNYSTAYLEEANSWGAEIEGTQSKETLPNVTANKSFASSLIITPCENYVLVVDDNRDMKNYISKILGEHWRVVSVNNGQEALDYIQAGSLPDIIVTDVMMPKLNGFELLNAIRSNSTTRGLPVILLSAKAEQEASEKGLNSTADSYMTKPFTASELIAKVNSTLFIGVVRKEVEAEKWHEIEALNVQLAQSNQDLKQFAYIASHDLKAPLRHISSFVELLLTRNKELDEQSQKYLDFIAAGTEKMSTLIQGLLDYSRVGHKSTKYETVDVNNVIADLVTVLKPSIQESDGKITYDTLPTAVVIKSQIEQLFLNLTSNALKFRRTGLSSQVHIKVIEKKSFYQFSVIDNGIGIAPEYKDKVFEVFQRLHSDAEYSGTGIGLAICMRVVINHDGRLWVETNEEGGATFNFTIKKIGLDG